MPLIERKAAGIHHAYSMADVPFPWRTEQAHTIMIGSTGTGKTTQMRALIAQMRVRRDRAVVFDLTGAYVEAFYNPDTDTILNPMDERCPSWSVFGAAKNHAEFTGIAAALKGNVQIGVIFGLVFVLAGLAFKMSVVPFHMWTPDVYEGAPTPVTTYFGSAPKVAAVALLVRVSIEAMGSAVTSWQQILIFTSLASIILGAVGAIGQTNIKRLLAYSSINNVGFVLVGLAAGTEAGVSATMTYMVIYVLMTLGSFACVLQMRAADGRHVEDIASLAGLSRLLIDSKRPKEAVKAFEGTDFSQIGHITSKGTLLEAYARALLAAGKKIKAIETFDQLLQLNLPTAWKDRINQELDQMAEDF